MITVAGTNLSEQGCLLSRAKCSQGTLLLLLQKVCSMRAGLGVGATLKTLQQDNVAGQALYSGIMVHVASNSWHEVLPYNRQQVYGQPTPTP